MARNAGATRVDWCGFPEAVAAALAGLTVLAAAARLDPQAQACTSAAVHAAAPPTAPVAAGSIEDAALRDMQLHD